MHIVDDQVGTPTWARSIAEATARLLAGAQGDFPAYLARHCGTYHVSCRGQASWWEFARAILARLPERERATTRVEAISTANYPTPAARPPYCVLDSSRLERTFGVTLPHWEHALDAMTSSEAGAHEAGPSSGQGEPQA